MEKSKGHNHPHMKTARRGMCLACDNEVYFPAMIAANQLLSAELEAHQVYREQVNSIRALATKWISCDDPPSYYGQPGEYQQMLDGNAIMRLLGEQQRRDN